MGFIGAIGAIAMLVFIVKCGRRAVDGIEDKKTWYGLLLSMFIMSVGICWPDIYASIGVFFMLAWWAYLVNWLYKIIAHKVVKRPKSTKKDFWMPAICFVLMILVVAVSPEKEVDASSLVAESTASSSVTSSSVEEMPDSIASDSDAEKEAAASKQAAQEAERNAALKAESERRAAASASSQKEEPASRELSEAEKAAESERNAALKAESEKRAASSKASSKPKKSSSSTASSNTVTTLDFDTVYKEYKSNEVRAEERYGKKKYRVTGNVNALTDDGLMNLMGGVTVTLTRKVGNTTVYFFCSFPKDQKSKIMQINTGDDITIVGEMRNMNFFSCELESYTRNGKTTTVY